MAAGVELIRSMAAGDRAAFAAFYDRYAPLAYGVILKVVRDRADGADVLQEVFWEAWRTATSYDAERGSPEAWIVMRARARAIDRVRARRRREETFVAPVADAVARDVGPDVARQVEDRDLVGAALDRLPPPQREAIELAYFEGLSQTEIAARLKQPLGTVKTRIRAGLERLREVMGRPA
ncbi:MAG TPA: sigma-70 family RNA polymerase sigma factor [Methylomirabilota bacterium]|jgi:RNA polymerase sigma-70 factor (ECF subfamily)